MKANLPPSSGTSRYQEIPLEFDVPTIDERSEELPLLAGQGDPIGSPCPASNGNSSERSSIVGTSNSSGISWYRDVPDDGGKLAFMALINYFGVYEKGDCILRMRRKHKFDLLAELYRKYLRLAGNTNFNHTTEIISR